MIQDFDGDGDESPTTTTDRSSGTTGSDGIVVGHVDIEDEFTEVRTEGVWWEGFSIPGL